MDHDDIDFRQQLAHSMMREVARRQDEAYFALARLFPPEPAKPVSRLARLRFRWKNRQRLGKRIAAAWEAFRYPERLDQNDW